MAAKKTSAATVVENVVVSAADRRSRAGATDGAKRASGSKRATAPAKKAAVKKAAPPAKKTAAKKAAPAKPVAKKTTPAKASAKKAPAKKSEVEKAAVKTSVAKKGPVPTGKKSPAKTPPTKTAPTKKAAATRAASKSSTPSSVSRLAVREGEKPWTAREVAEVTEVLERDRSRLRDEIAAAEEEISHLLREGGEGAGHDQADVGSNTFERDHEMTMAKNARDNLVLVEEALQRIQDGTYGVCESCGLPIGKMRLQAFPRATLCMECKQRQERR